MGRLSNELSGPIFKEAGRALNRGGVQKSLCGVLGLGDYYYVRLGLGFIEGKGNKERVFDEKLCFQEVDLRK